jgi:hypothetical protein
VKFTDRMKRIKVPLPPVVTSKAYFLLTLNFLL